MLTVALPLFFLWCRNDRCADLTEQAKKAGIKFKVDMLVTPGSELVSPPFLLYCM